MDRAAQPHPAIRMMIGITGNIGSGKSTAAQLFAKYGFVILDSDNIVHDLLRHDPEVIKAVKSHFSAAILNSEMNIDRKKLGDIVFNNEEDLKFLEQLLHPKVRAHWLELAKQSPQQKYIVEVPLLFEKGYEADFDKTICVIADEESTHSRLSKRGLSVSEMNLRLSKFLSIDEKMKRADIVLFNNSTLDILKEQVDLCVNHIINK